MTSPLRLSLQQIQSQGGAAKEQTDRYKEVLNQVLCESSEQVKCDQLKVYIDCIINENVSLVISRQLLSEIAQLIAQSPPKSSKELSQFALDRIQPRAVSFEEQVGVIRKHLAGLYEADKQWRTAADILVSFWTQDD